MEYHNVMDRKTKRTEMVKQYHAVYASTSVGW